MTSPTPLQIVTQAVEELNAEPDRKLKIPVAGSTPLVGVDSLLDSLDLIKVLTFVEEQLAGMGYRVNIADDEAIGEVPWATVASLAEHVEKRMR
jgi:acyl carrier protein